MSAFLEQLIEEMNEAQKRFALAQQDLQRAQAVFQAAAQEFQSYQHIVAARTRKEQEGSASPATIVGKGAAAPVAALPPQQTEIDEINKTELVRELLRQHPNGMTGRELWSAVKDKFLHRQYVYSVLKRLKKKGYVVQKRKKYVFTAKPEEVTQQSLIQ